MHLFNARHTWKVLLGSAFVVGALAACTSGTPARIAGETTPAPFTPAPIARTDNATVTIKLETVEKRMPLADGVEYEFWTFGGAVPGPMVRVKQGDTVELTLKTMPPADTPTTLTCTRSTARAAARRLPQPFPGRKPPSSSKR